MNFAKSCKVVYIINGIKARNYAILYFLIYFYFRYILTQTDYFSKYVEAFAIPEKSAICVAEGLYKSFCRHGAPVHVISDQGREFVNQVGK